MRDYPFNELDYFTRKDEGGFSRLLAFLDQPSKDTFALIPEGLKNPGETDPGFWGAVQHRCFAGIQRIDVIYEVLTLCFDVAYYKIKEKWYDYMGEKARRDELSQQCSFSLDVCRKNVYRDPDWQEYREVYERSYSEFFERIQDSLHGYPVEEFEGHANQEPVAVEMPIGYTLRCSKNQQLPLISRLCDLLRQHAFIETTINNFLPVFIGQPILSPVVWLGTNSELKYFINALVTRGCLDMQDNDWARATRIFKHPDGFFTRRQLADNYTPPRAERKEHLNQVLAALHARGVGRAPVEPLA